MRFVVRYTRTLPVGTSLPLPLCLLSRGALFSRARAHCLPLPHALRLAFAGRRVASTLPLPARCLCARARALGAHDAFPSILLPLALALLVPMRFAHTAYRAFLASSLPCLPLTSHCWLLSLPHPHLVPRLIASLTAAVPLFPHLWLPLPFCCP